MQTAENFVTPGIRNVLITFYEETRAELDEILSYWSTHSPDLENGGFVGRIDPSNAVYPDAAKGSVLNARILWSFSAGYATTKNPQHLALAERAFQYFTTHFLDQQFGGVYWSVDALGKPLDTKKQIYALAFAIYGCAAYFSVTGAAEARETAIELYHTIEKHSFDPVHTGYLEAFSREWMPIDDLRLSDKDENEKKTMNTHLHILEAYTGLYRVWPDEQLKDRIVKLLSNFTDQIADKSTGHLGLFFDERWNKRSSIVSYGHDIEAAWLIMEAAGAINDLELIQAVENAAAQLAVAACEGLEPGGGLWYEYDPGPGHIMKEKHWWVQAEAMVGFFNHWELTGDSAYLHRSIQSWQYIKTEIKDQGYGEWLWGRNGDGSVMQNQDKVGLWKCPYHNSRACIEISSRVARILNLQAK